jgi:superfamily II DNA or RNA helicase
MAAAPTPAGTFMTNTFADFYATLVHLEPDPQKRGKKLFEPVCKWFLQNDPLYAHELKDVWLWNEWPDNWKETEAGIDLVAETYDGKLWAIQAKAYDENNAVSMHDMSQFLAESARKGKDEQPLFDFRLLITTTDLLTFHAKDVADGSLIPVGIVDRSRLDSAEITWPATFADIYGVVPQPGPKLPFAYQQKAIADVVKGFAGCARGQVIVACGGGKTLIANWIREDLNAQFTVVFVPSLSLLDQTRREWRVNLSVDYDELVVCSDQSVGYDDAVSSVSHLGVPVTTISSKVTEWLRKDSFKPKVIFCTYQSASVIALALHQEGIPEIDLLIADEAHRTAGRVGAEFTIILDNNKIPAKRRLFMTATEKFYTQRVKKGAADSGYDIEFASMDDEEKYGPVFYRLSFREAMDLGRLTDYEVHIVVVKENDPEFSKYLDWAVDRHYVRIDESGDVTDASKVAAQIALGELIKEYNLHRVITYHSRIEHAKEFAATLVEVIDLIDEDRRPDVTVWAQHTSGEDSTRNRSKVLRKLRDVDEAKECGVLTNARCLTEGIDVPALDGEAFVDPKRSLIDIIQAVGRVLRVAPGKDKGHIILPVFMHEGDDPDEVLEASAFEPVWSVLKALRAHDEELAEWIDDYRCMLGKLGGKGYKGPVNLPPKITVNLGHLLGADFYRAFALKLVEVTSPSWEEWYGLLEAYVEKNHTALVQGDHVTADAQKLGVWVRAQRDRYGKDLSADRVERLEKMPGWVWDANDAAWQEKFSQLSEYVAKTGDTVLTRSLECNGVKLGQWVGQQRQLYAKGNLQAKPERVELLNSIDGWEWNPLDAAWTKNFCRLQDYVAKTGAVPKTDEKTDDGFKIGGWARDQRATFAEGNLSTERIELLSSIDGWDWNPLETAWKNGLHYLQTYRDREGDALVQATYKTDDGFPLGSWVNQQRGKYAKGVLQAKYPERVKLLEAVDGWAWKAPFGPRGARPKKAPS